MLKIGRLRSSKPWVGVRSCPGRYSKYSNGKASEIMSLAVLCVELFAVLNRRSQKKSLTRGSFAKLLKRFPKPKYM